MEHVRHDKAFSGLEYDEARYGQIRDNRMPCLVVSSTRPELSPAEFLPEVVPYAVDRRGVRDKLSHSGSLPSSVWKRVLWIIFTLAIVAIAVGLGVRFGIIGKKAQTSLNTIPPLSQHRILDDTSISAISTSKGDRHIFFQDFTGTVRQAIYTTSTQRWASSLSFVVAIDAKNYTPLALVIDPEDNLILFYITANHTLNVKSFSGGGWQSNATELLQAGFANHIAAPSSRDLSVTFVPGGQELDLRVPDSNASIPELLLFYENQSGNISSLLLSVTHGPHFPSHKWKDISTALYSSQPDVKFSSPFNSVLARQNNPGFWQTTLSATPSTNQSTSAYVQAVFYDSSGSDSGQNSNSVVFSRYANGTFTTSSRVNVTGPSLLQSDITQPGLPSGDLAIMPLCGAWVNGTALSSLCPTDVHIPPQNAPLSSYPFKRLASTTAQNSTTFYVYHQLDAVTFAEDWWDQEGSGGWMTSNVSIETV